VALLYGQLRAAILDRRLRPVRECPHPALAKQHGVSRGTVVAALIILEVKATSRCEWAQARSWPRPYLTKLLRNKEKGLATRESRRHAQLCPNEDF